MVPTLFVLMGIADANYKFIIVDIGAMRDETMVVFLRHHKLVQVLILPNSMYPVNN